MNIKNEQHKLENKAKFYVEQIWGLDFNLPIKINWRLKKTLGRLIINGKLSRIELSKSLFNLEELTIDDVLIHELCHWILWKQDKRYNDGDDEFENELKKVGSHSTEQIMLGEIYHSYTCVLCGKTHYSNFTKDILMDSNLFKSSCCKALITLNNEVKYEDRNDHHENIFILNKKYKSLYYII